MTDLKSIINEQKAIDNAKATVDQAHDAMNAIINLFEAPEFFHQR